MRKHEKSTRCDSLAFIALLTEEQVTRNVARSFIVFYAVLAATSAIAQNSIQVIPFAFSAAQQTLPAGDDRITLDRELNLVSVRGENAVATFLLCLPLTFKCSKTCSRTCLGFPFVKANILKSQNLVCRQNGDWLGYRPRGVR